MRLAFAGTPEVAVPSLQALLDAGHDVVAVITRPDAPAGRGRALTESPVAVFAAARGLTVMKPRRLADVSDELRSLQLECVAVVAYGGLVPPELLDLPSHGWINLHFSLLPAWRGAAPVQRAIIAGDEVTGACTFRIERGLDTGPVFGSLTRTIAPGDTAGSLLEALAADGAILLAQTIANLASLQAQPQAGDASFAPKLTKDEARVVWAHPAFAVDRRIRGCTPEPGAWSEASGLRIGIGPVVVRPDVTGLAAGDVRRDGRAVLVGTATSAVQLGDVKPQGKSWMDADAWMRGVRGEVVFVDAHR